MDGAVTGVHFPEVDGRRSTTGTGREVLATAVAAADAGAAAAIRAERDWRGGYPAHLRTLTAVAAGSADAGGAIARAGLEAAHAAFVHAGPDGDRPVRDAVADDPAAPLGTAEVKGGGAAPAGLEVPYRGRMLRGDDLLRQLDDWVARDVVEPSLRTALGRVAAEPDWLDLRDLTVAVLGAGAEMAPTEHLLAWGATVAGVDLPRPDLWRRLVAAAEAGPGRLLLPVPDGGTEPDRAGVDLLVDVAAARQWLVDLPGPLTLGNFVYADGERFARVSVAVDGVVESVLRRRRDAGLAMIATPTDVFAVPPEAVAAAHSRAQRGDTAVRFGRLLRGVTRGRSFAPAYTGTAPGAPGIADLIVVQQGPNYALAKRLQRWRATVARLDGAVSSAHVAPPSGTRSVLKNRALAAAFAGAGAFGVEVFRPETARALTAALLVHDLRHPGSTARPDTTLRTSEHQFMDAANHGGLWRIPWQARTALPYAAALGLPKALLPRR